MLIKYDICRCLLKIWAMTEHDQQNLWQSCLKTQCKLNWLWAKNLTENPKKWYLSPGFSRFQNSPMYQLHGIFLFCVFLKRHCIGQFISTDGKLCIENKAIVSGKNEQIVSGKQILSNWIYLQKIRNIRWESSHHWIFYNRWKHLRKMFPHWNVCKNTQNLLFYHYFRVVVTVKITSSLSSYYTVPTPWYIL